MPDSIMYQEDAYVVLETNQPEQYFTAEELLEKLKGILQTHQEDLPRDLQNLPSIEEQAKHLRDTYCEFNLDPQQYLQWYVVRMEK
ncbi:MAG: chlororespiratory reduction protein 7 [Cyanobacteria bacterium QS_7_48_42]|nr:MAG: chlororespiratory reduction protein 7 [Cyanobacteria bacterium QH_10_48_56]PSO60302.1 MAG: chlororespiratory reduction protein 7 [Cyanobacteria bacterium QH_7_48_89]PSO71400.1 MAG: chlororespiratory reduction protein 7 [Cyanobacteria bacterium QS_1_48_34]PSO76173.1 MAG: chlororespiratory reduction protein 7 [Cyanobacteria bacterium QH_3_48_40]PSO80239.1 MAG: chlororespiratory reduction protein 7 [Cyanobacteria bacterium QS_4_48_99]PSO84199.1 MAG: chlororespiratory reduction protein 7 [